MNWEITFVTFTIKRLLDYYGDHIGTGGFRGANPAMTSIQFCQGLWPPSSEEKPFTLNFLNSCDYFVKKVVSEIRKCHHCSFSGTSSIWPSDHYMLAQTWSYARHV